VLELLFGILFVIWHILFAVAVGEFSPVFFKLWELEGIYLQARDGRKQCQIYMI